MNKKIESALISVYHKEGLDNIIRCLAKNNVKIFSTGGTYEYIKELNIACTKVEDITGFPTIFDGRVKTLHPSIFGGILAVRNQKKHIEDAADLKIPLIDMVIVDLYPFEETLQKTSNQNMLIDKIDIGGVSLIRAAAKNFNDVFVIASSKQYDEAYSILEENKCVTTTEIRQKFAKEAFGMSSHYDAQIYNWFDNNSASELKLSYQNSEHLRYGENPHQGPAKFFGNLSEVFTQLNGKELSYNNLLDCDAAINLILDFEESTIAILKHNNACGIASRENLKEAWKLALASDPVSAFGGVIVSNRIIDNETAREINKIFFEIIIAPNYSKEALDILMQKSDRRILVIKNSKLPDFTVRSILNGYAYQHRDTTTEKESDFTFVTTKQPNKEQIEDLLYANIVVKHTKSNAIVLAKDKHMITSGIGQTNRIDALKQAIDKAKQFKISLEGAVMASDAFFPFADCVELAAKEGIKTVIQPGGSIRDKESIDFCNKNDVAMVFTGVRHFRH